jgi:hypothetical protein
MADHDKGRPRPAREVIGAVLPYAATAADFVIEAARDARERRFVQELVNIMFSF